MQPQQQQHGQKYEYDALRQNDGYSSASGSKQRGDGVLENPNTGGSDNNAPLDQFGYGGLTEWPLSPVGHQRLSPVPGDVFYGSYNTAFLNGSDDNNLLETDQSSSRAASQSISEVNATYPALAPEGGDYSTAAEDGRILEPHSNDVCVACCFLCANFPYPTHCFLIL